MAGSFTVDLLDRQLIQALQIAGRAPFSRIAAVLDSSEQTIARRYRRLTEAGILRVLALPAPPPGLNWYVRIGVRPGAAAPLAQALAGRDDVAWVSITSGGAEVVCVSRPATYEQRDALLLERLPRTSAVTRLEALAVLRVFSDAPRYEWLGLGAPLTADQIAALEHERIGFRAEAAGGAQLEPGDAELLARLREDGRASFAQLSAVTGMSAARVARRVELLFATGACWLDVDLALEPLGFPVLAILWLTVAPSELEAVGEALAALPLTGFTGAVSGPANLTVSLACRDTAELYSYLSREIGGIAAITRAEVSPVLRRIKQAGSVLSDGRLPPPAYAA